MSGLQTVLSDQAKRRRLEIHDVILPIQPSFGCIFLAWTGYTWNRLAEKMLTAVQTMVSKLVSPIWRTAEATEEDVSSTIGEYSPSAARACRETTPPECLSFHRSAGIESIRSGNGGVVTRLNLGSGMIDDAVGFTAAEVLGGVLLQPGDLVNYTAVRDGPHGGWKALRVRMPPPPPPPNYPATCILVEASGTIGVQHHVVHCSFGGMVAGLKM